MLDPLDCPCGHATHRQPRTRTAALVLAYHMDMVKDLLTLVERDSSRWLGVLRCTKCGQLWAEDSMSSGHADMCYIYPIRTIDPHGWLERAASLKLTVG